MTGSEKAGATHDWPEFRYGAAILTQY